MKVMLLRKMRVFLYIGFKLVMGFYFKDFIVSCLEIRLIRWLDFLLFRGNRYC